MKPGGRHAAAVDAELKGVTILGLLNPPDQAFIDETRAGFAQMNCPLGGRGSGR